MTFMDIIAMISNMANAVAQTFGFAKQRDAEHNTAAMVQNKTATAEVQAQEQVDKDLAAKNLAAIQKDVS